MLRSPRSGPSMRIILYAVSISCALTRELSAEELVALPTIDVVATRFNDARNNILPQVGASSYELSRSTIDAAPQGANAPLNNVLLQAPGVAQDSFGQLHVRGDHANLQYRINGVIIPEAISGFGQALEARFADRITLMTGALPAEYGYRTAGVIDIQTKSGALTPGGSVSVYGGGAGAFNPSIEYGGSVGRWDYYISGNFLTSGRGIENPTSSFLPTHDLTNQGKEFAFISGAIDDTTRLSFFGGTSVGTFKIPNNPGQATSFQVNGLTDFDSSKLNEHQREENHYGVVALQTTFDKADAQIAYFARYSATHFTPDTLGDLLFNGVASDVFRSSFAQGMQADMSYRLNESHTLRSGLFFSAEHTISSNNSQVLPGDGTGAQATDALGNPLDIPFGIIDKSSKVGYLAGVYIQDEWKATDRLTINAGLRFDQMWQYVNANQLSPRINAVYKLTDDTTLHAGYARYFTPPAQELIATSTLGLFNNTTNQPQNFLNSPVQPERSHYFDAGFTHKLTQNLQVGVDAYYKAVENLIDEGQFGAALVFTPFNYAQGRIYGIEGTVSYKQDDLSLYGNIAWGRAMGKNIVSGQFNFDPVAELPYIANHWIYLDHDQRVTGSAGASYKWNDTTFSAKAIYGSGLRAGFANTGVLPAYWQFDAGLSHEFKFGNQKITARLDVINLFDNAYELRDGSGVGVGAPQWGPRRTIMVGLSRAL